MNQPYRCKSERGSRRVAKRRTKADRALAERMLALLKSGADVRKKRVRRVRARIRDRSYENRLKLEIAVDRLLEDLMT